MSEAEDVASLTPTDRALVTLGRELQALGYRFTTVTPATHARVNARPENAWARTVADVFGWSRPFRRGDVPESLVTLLGEAKELEAVPGGFRSKVRFSSLAELLFVHSAFPTEAPDSVFFGPDTYRFARALRHSLASFTTPSRVRIVDLGCGSGAGGLYVASLLAPAARSAVVLADINPKALRSSRVNATLNGIPDVFCTQSDLFAGIEGTADLVIANPPYLVDPLARAYRHGGGDLGFGLSLRIVAESLPRLAPGGRLVLYTGAPVVNGVDTFRQALSPVLAQDAYDLAYEEVDPDVFGEELEHDPYDRADRIAVVVLTVDAPRLQELA